MKKEYIDLADVFDDNGEIIPVCNREFYIEQYVDLANDEFLKNGESDEFKLMQYTIAKSKNAGHIICFAKNVYGANHKLLEKAICKTENAEAITTYAYVIDDVNIEGLLDKVCEIGNEKCLATFGIKVLGKFEKIDKNRINKIMNALDNSANYVKKEKYKKQLQKFLSKRELENSVIEK